MKIIRELAVGTQRSPTDSLPRKGGYASVGTQVSARVVHAPNAASHLCYVSVILFANVKLAEG